MERNKKYTELQGKVINRKRKKKTKKHQRKEISKYLN